MPETTTNPTFHEDNNPAQAVHASIFSTPIKPTPFYKRGIFLFIVVLLLTIGAAAGGLYYYKNLPKKNSTLVKTSQGNKKSNASLAPKFSSGKYTFSGVVPPLPELNTYTLKASYSQEEVKDFASKLGLDTATPQDKENNIYVTSEKPETRGLLVFNTKSGSFLYQSFGTFAPPEYKNLPPTQEATSLLTTLGVYDPTITCDVTYKNKNTPGITYVECHRLWTTLNAPLLNLGGTLNIPENVSISSLTPGKTNALVSSSDPAIIDVSNGGNGLGRPNQFNTITVGFSSQGTVYSINSTMRKIESTTPVSSSELVSAQEALDYFKKGGGILSLTIPTGSGNVDWNKIYLNNTAHADVAAITEITPAFIDMPLKNGQSLYEPYYLIRGTARLDSGYNVMFTQSIPALKSKLASASQRIADDDTLQLGTFNLPTKTPNTNNPPDDPSDPSNTPTITVTPTTDLPIVTPSLTPQVVRNDLPPVCHVLDARGEETFSVNVEGYGQLNIGSYPRGNYHTFNFVTDKVITNFEEISKLRNHLFTALEDQFVILSARSMLSKNYNPFGSPSQKIYTEDKNSPPDFTRILLPSTGDISGVTTENGPESMVVNSNIRSKINAIKNNRKLLSETALKPNLFPSIYLSEINTGFIYLFDTNFLYNSTPLPADFVPAPGQQVSCYLSGLSPHIFVYKKGSETISIKTPTSTIFSDPATDSYIWSVKTNDKSEIRTLDGKMRSSLYYEYDPIDVKFTQSSKGYVVDRKNIKSLIGSIANKLGLTKNEAQALLSDTLNTLVDLPSAKYIKISLLNEGEINTELPLEVSPKPTTISRIHLMISNAQSLYSLPEPTIKKIERSEYSVVELGAYLSK